MDSLVFCSVKTFPLSRKMVSRHRLISGLCCFAFLVHVSTAVTSINSSQGSQEVHKRNDETDAMQGIIDRVLFSQPVEVGENDDAYFVSKVGFREYWPAVEFCRLTGKIIAEVDNGTDLMALQVNAGSNEIAPLEFQAFYTGLNDILNEGSYVFEVSKKRPSFSQWGCQEPDGGRAENCMALVEWCSWGITDIPCEGNWRPTGVICKNLIRSDVVIQTKDLRFALFYPPFSYKKSKFYVSRITVPSVDAAISVCIMIKGFLAEINSWSKLNNLRAALTSNFVGDHHNYLYIAGTDKKVEGDWVYQKGRRPATFFDWLGGAPTHGTLANCVALKNIWKMVDVPCDKGTLRHVASFLCEVTAESESGV